MTVFRQDQIDALNAPLDRQRVAQREQGGATLSYIEAWHAIAEANRIFGFDAWDRETVDFKCVSERERKIGRAQRDGWGVTYIAKVRVTVGNVVREGSGAGHGIDTDLGLAHESALKEAESDAMKRALMTFGNPFGLALYDKTQANVEDASDRHKREAIDSLWDELSSIGTQAGLKSFWIDNWPSIKQMDEVTLKRFADKKDALKRQLDKPTDTTVADIEDTFPGSRVVNETLHPLMAGE